MKVVLLHGPAIEASRKKLLEIKQKFNYEETVIFDSTNSPGEVLTNLQSESLFGGERLIIWENPPDDLPAGRQVFSPLIYLNSLTLILWFDHEIDPKKWPDTEVYFFPEAKEISVFPFLDYLGNKDIKAFLEMEKLKKSGFDLQYLITMILYLLRNLVATPKGAKDFVKTKFARMRKNFSGEQLINIYQFVLSTDFKIKSGLMEIEQGEFSLVQKFVES